MSLEHFYNGSLATCLHNFFEDDEDLWQQSEFDEDTSMQANYRE